MIERGAAENGSTQRVSPSAFDLEIISELSNDEIRRLMTVEEKSGWNSSTATRWSAWCAWCGAGPATGWASRRCERAVSDQRSAFSNCRTRRPTGKLECRSQQSGTGNKP
jgi:hypothetical protein